MYSVIKPRFGSETIIKTVHTKKIKLSNGIHLKCKWLHCPAQLKDYTTHNPTGICASILIKNTIITKYCFCG